MKQTGGVGLATLATIAMRDKIAWGSVLTPDQLFTSQQQSDFRGHSWIPDTCPPPGCMVEEIYSGTTIIGMGQVLRKCPAHIAVPDSQLYGVLYSNPDGENKRKNRIFKEMLEKFSGSLSELKTSADGSQTFDWKGGVTVSWVYTGAGSARLLTITVIGVNLTNNQKNLIQNYCDTNFGIGKVVLVN